MLCLLDADVPATGFVNCSKRRWNRKIQNGGPFLFNSSARVKIWFRIAIGHPQVGAEVLQRLDQERNFSSGIVATSLG